MDSSLPQIAMASLEKIEVLGTGSFGEVSLSFWKDRQMLVAVKANLFGKECVNPLAIDNERKLLEKLHRRPHRNILPALGVVTDAPDGSVRLVMGYCDGGNLDDYLRLIGNHQSDTASAGGSRT